MNADSSWHAVLRLVWLTGGVVAVNEPGAKVQIKAGINGKLIETFEIVGYANLFAALRAKGLTILGVTFVIDRRELELLWRPEFG